MLMYVGLAQCPSAILRKRNGECSLTRAYRSFYCPSAKLVIEVDGSQHYESEGMVHDKIRTETLNQYGLTVLRFTNRQVNREFENVCLCIDLFLKGEMTLADMN